MSVHASPSPLVVALGADNNYAMPMAVAVSSILEHLDPEMHLVLYILDGGIRQDRRHRVERVTSSARPQVQLRWKHPKPGGFDDLPTRDHISTTAYHRLLIPDVLPNATRQCFYLDCDVIAHRSVQALMEIPFEENAILASPNMGWDHNFEHDNRIEFRPMSLFPQTIGSSIPVSW